MGNQGAGGAAAEAEAAPPAPAAEAAPPVPTAEPAEAKPEASVGVLGWLGFIILNIAAWGIIGVSSTLQWVIGFVVCVVYTVLVIVLAVLMPRWGDRFKAFENLLWVLGCIFVCVLGLYLSFNLVCKETGECGSGSGSGGGGGGSGGALIDVSKLVENSSSAALRDWAAEPFDFAYQGSSYANFEGYTIFLGRDEADTGSSSGTYLLRSSGSTAVKVSPSLSTGSSFTKFSGNLYFFGQATSNVGYEAGFYTMSPSGAANGSAELLVVPGGREIGALFGDGGKLYFKAEAWCNRGQARTIFESDGTPAGTVNLRGAGDLCSSAQFDTTTDVEPFIDAGGFNEDKPTKTLWSGIFLAIVPMLGMAAVLLWYKQLPGVILNLYYGVAALIVLVYLIAETNEQNIGDFLKWFLTLYTAAGYIAITFASLLMKRLTPLLDGMTDWMVVLAGVPFTVMIFIDLEIPVAEEAWKWIMFVFTLLFQMFVSVAIGRTLPMVLGALQAFVTSWKIAREIVKVIFGSDNLGEVEVLTLLGLMALQGIGIIVGAILYASRRAEIEALVRGGLRRCLKIAEEAKTANASD